MPNLPNRGRQWMAAAVLLAVAFAGSTLLTPLYGVYQRAYGFSELTLTLIYSAYVLGNLAALLVFGRVSDQIGRKPTAFAALGGAAASSLLFLAASGTPWLFAGRALSGLSVGVAAGTATAWITELAPGRDKDRGASIASFANIIGIACGPVLGGLLVQYAPVPLRLCHVVYLAVLAATALLVATAPETVPRRPGVWRRLSLRPRLGVPSGIAGRFRSAAGTGFAALALVGFFAALGPSLLRRDLGQTNVAEGGAVVSLMFFAGLPGVWLTGVLGSVRAMVGGLASLFAGLVFLVLAESLRSLPLLLAGAVVGGVATAAAYRGSLGVVNQIAPDERRGEVVSSYFVFVFLGNAVPVIGIGVLSQLATPGAADVSFSAVIAVIALFALVAASRQARAAAGRHLG